MPSVSLLPFQRLQRQQVIPEDQPVVEDVLVGHTMAGVTEFLRVFQQDARLRLGRFSLPIQVSSSFWLRGVMGIHSYDGTNAEILWVLCGQPNGGIGAWPNYATRRANPSRYPASRCNQKRAVLPNTRSDARLYLC